jgi:pimeloyl-ACP methyl ester carboxylesterase
LLWALRDAFLVEPLEAPVRVLRKSTIKTTGCLSALLVLALCASSASAMAAGRRSTRRSSDVDELVLVHGAHLHARCVGSGPITVLLIAGFGDTGGNWGAVEPTLSEGSRVCSYDRFGDATSDAPPRTQTFASEAKDLRTLLRSIKEPGPYVVVGHSFGGAEAVTFAKLFPKEVHGLLLLDASPTTWNKAVCAVRADGSDAANSFQQLCASLRDPAKNPEHLDAPVAFGEVAKIRSLGRLPLIVATAADHPYGLAPDVEAHLSNVWNRGQDRWVSLSSSSKLVSVPNTGHYIQVDQPAVVIEQIQTLLPN